MRGLRVLLPGPDSGALATLLTARGARPVRVPTVAIRPVDDPALDQALANAEAYDWIVVTSANGVRAVFDRLRASGRAAPAGPRWAAVGPRTARALAAEGVRAALVPAAGTGAAIPDGMGDVAGVRVLLARARGAGRDLPAILAARGARVDDLAAYETVEGPEESRAPIARALDEGLDAAIFTSGSTARGFVRLAGGAAALAGAIVVCIGPSTAAAAEAAGLVPDAVATGRTPKGLVAALEAAWTAAGRTPETTR